MLKIRWRKSKSHKRVGKIQSIWFMNKIGFLLLVAILSIVCGSCKKKDETPSCLTGVVLGPANNYICTILIQVTNAKVGTPFTYQSKKYDYVIQTSSDVGPNGGKKIYFNYRPYTKHEQDSLGGKCISQYIPPNVPEYNITKYSTTKCP